jgi:hypothetical protein
MGSSQDVAATSHGQQQLVKARRPQRRRLDDVCDDELTPGEAAKAWHWKYGLEINPSRGNRP